MMEGLRRNGALIIGWTICGAICVAVRPFTMTAQGSAGPSLLHAESPIGAMVALAVAIGVASLAAVITGRLTNTAVGLFVLGGGLFVLSLRLGTLVDLALENGSLGLLAVECVILGGMLCAAVLLVFRLSGRLEDIEPREGEDAEPIWSPAAVATAVGAGMVMLPSVWLLARSPLSGQALGATMLGGVAVGLVGRLIRPNLQPVLLFVTPMLAGAIGHAVGGALTGGPLESAMVDGRLHALSSPMPIHYAAGTLMGVSMGLGWARSFLHHEHEHEDEDEHERGTQREPRGQPNPPVADG